ncbi:uncharacterized protein LOC133789699 [Humulus lupulus]|uniref:uncharacterized protein LOC133789699 n=1 Tax=Humulus lupulus TaxID=3486 RepID=UPI002B40AB66|nr:uncharacterized protein LOC133789699 [Humulus lupulus]
MEESRSQPERLAHGFLRWGPLEYSLALESLYQSHFIPDKQEHKHQGNTKRGGPRQQIRIKNWWRREEKETKNLSRFTPRNQGYVLVELASETAQICTIRKLLYSNNGDSKSQVRLGSQRLDLTIGEGEGENAEQGNQFFRKQPQRKRRGFLSGDTDNHISDVIMDYPFILVPNRQKYVHRVSQWFGTCHKSMILWPSSPHHHHHHYHRPQEIRDNQELGDLNKLFYHLFASNHFPSQVITQLLLLQLFHVYLQTKIEE